MDRARQALGEYCGFSLKPESTMSDSDLDNELLAIAGQAKKKASRGKRRRDDDSDEDVSFDAADEEDDLEEVTGGSCPGVMQS